MNLTTVAVFGWFPHGAKTLNAILQNGFFFFMMMDFWYLLGGVIFVLVPVMFLSVFMFEYLKGSVELETRRSTFFELAYLTMVGVIPIPALHISRIYLTFIPMLDPQVLLQREYMEEVLRIQEQEWSPRTHPLSDQTLQTGYYSLIVVGSYFLLLLLLDYLSKKRFMIDPIEQRVRDLATSVKDTLNSLRIVYSMVLFRDKRMFACSWKQEEQGDKLVGWDKI